MSTSGPISTPDQQHLDLLGVFRGLRQRRRHLFCLVMAAIGCAFMPHGAGVLTLVVPTRPSAKPLLAPA